MLMQKYRLALPEADEMDARMTQTAAAEGLDFHLEGTATGNTFDAHQLVHLGRDRGLEDAVVERFYRAYFTEQRSLFAKESLLDLAAEAGLDREEAAATLRDNRYAEAVAADIESARRLGATGVPFFVIDGQYGISGAQAPEVFLEVLQKAAGAITSR
jgi:predicted DsbA family dithiol-disulfide isomerase